MNNKMLVVLFVVVGIIFIVVAGIYFIQPAKNLPSFFPGYDPTLAKTHFKHGIGAAILAFGAFIFAWFKSGKKASTPK